jgi:hypothetical protein
MAECQGAYRTFLLAKLGQRRHIPIDSPNLINPADRYWPDIPDHNLNLMF